MSSSGDVERDTTYDPVLPLKEAAEYLGFRGKYPTRSLRRLNLERTPIAGVGDQRMGVRLSVLNAYLARRQSLASRAPVLRSPAPMPDTPRERGKFAKRRTA